MATKSKQTDVPDAVKKALLSLQKSTRAANEMSGGIERLEKSSNTRIAVREDMTLDDAVKHIKNFQNDQETDAAKRIELTCHPSDGLVCTHRAIEETFGAMLSKEKETFFYVIPALSEVVKIGVRETVTVPVGNCVIPGLDITLDISTKENSENPCRGTLYVVVRYKKMYEPLVQQIEHLITEKIAKYSIFRGKAIDSNFEFINVENKHPLVHSALEARKLTANVLSAIRNTDACEKAKIPLRRNILLSGRYGTGKSLTALAIARECVANGWTFMSVRPRDKFDSAVRFAADYQPCVVFFEDIDSITHGERDDTLNSILNTVDGILSKNAKVIVVATTNHIERISPAMLRPGRIDDVIDMGILDPDAAFNLTVAYSGDVEGLTKESVWEAVSGDGRPESVYTPAFIVEAVNKSRLYAIAASGTPNVTADDITDSLRGLRRQFDLMLNNKPSAPSTGLDLLVNGAKDATLANEKVKELEEQVNNIAVHVQYLYDRA